MYKILIASLLVFGLQAEAKVRMGIASDSTYCGERELAWRIKIAGESLGWTVVLDENKGKGLRRAKKLDWVICLIPYNTFLHPRCSNYMTIFHPFNHLDEERKLLPFYERYDGFLLTINNTESIADSFKLKNRELYSIPFYPTVHKVPYRRVELNNLVTMLPVWSNRLRDEKFQRLYQLLSQTGFVKFYGVARTAKMVEDGYMGELPFDGVTVINVLQKHGIALIFHSDIHNQEGIPSSRIFEAAAASAVIISDENAFVRKHFGDAVFYIDTFLSAEEIFLQIQEHLGTIHANPERALDKAKEAHQIFTDHFLMSDQLLQLEAMHNQRKLKKQERDA